MTVPESMNADTKGPGVPLLLMHLSAMAGESVYLWHNPSRGEMQWFVWTGHPAGSGGGEWGRGATAYGALNDAFVRLTDAIFHGRTDA